MDDKTFEQELMEALSKPVENFDASNWGCIFILKEPTEEDYRRIDFSKSNRVDNEKDYGILVIPDDL